MPITRILCAAAVAVMLLAAGPPGVRGQAVVGDVVSADDGTPVIGAFVVLVDADGRRGAAAIAGPDGRYALRAARTGRYTLMVERIGFETIVSPVLDIRDGTTTHRFEVPARAVQLPGITVESATRGCGRNSGGPAVQSLWDEIRKALHLAVFTRQNAGIRYTLVQAEREIDGNRLLSESRHPRVVTSALPYVTGSDADALVAEGFLQDTEDGTILIGPDADVLLSDAFLDGYCFGIASSGDDEVGLTFEPMRGRGPTGIQGVLWVDARSAELRRIEYEYTNLPEPLDRFGAGGVTEFRQMVGGMWIVGDWRIRSPMVSVAATGGSVRQFAVREEGGTVVAARVRGATLFELDASARVRGSLFDAVHGRPAAGATVSLSGTPFFGVADDDGTFSIEAPAGRYALAVSTPWIADMRIPIPMDSVTLLPEDTVTVDLATPSLAQVRAHLCPPDRNRRTIADTGIVYGRVYDAAGEPVPNARVRASFGSQYVQMYTDVGGVYRLCGVPMATHVTLRVWPRREHTRETGLVVEGSPFARHDSHP